MVSKGQIVGIDWNRIARLHSHVLVFCFDGEKQPLFVTVSFFFYLRLAS